MHTCSTMCYNKIQYTQTSSKASELKVLNHICDVIYVKKWFAYIVRNHDVNVFVTGTTLVDIICYRHH